MDKQNKPQPTSEGEVTPEAPAGPLHARSPYRPLSRRKRQEQVVEPPPAVERPNVSLRFDASPTRISAALAKAGTSQDEAILAWRAAVARATADSGADIEVEVAVEVDVVETEPEG